MNASPTVTESCRVFVRFRAAATQQFKDQPQELHLSQCCPRQYSGAHDCEEAIARRGFKKVAILADSTNYDSVVRT
jgi:branched-chain amino acid transport system substrate-binding protein